MDSETFQLVLEAMRQLHLEQKGLASLIGVSVRTVQRHRHNAGLPYATDGHKLAVELYPKNPALAARLAAAFGTTLQDLGLHPPPSSQVAVEAPPTRPAGPPPLPPARQGDADAVVCAAADALGIVPRDARPTVAAIFARALALEVELGSLAILLGGPKPAPGKPASKK